MKVVLKVILSFALSLVLILLAMIVFAFWKPVTASKTIWPVVENYMLEEPFLGITANGTVIPDLFRIESTGVSTQPVVAAANNFIASLSEAQRGRLLFPVDDLEWRRWANIHISTRQGVGLLEMNEYQSRAAMELLGTGLSSRGLQTSRDIMRLEGHLADLMDDHEQYGEKRYWFTIMGEPSMTEPWGWQIDGHHLIINYFLLGDQVVVTPMFMGSEPTSAATGRFAGTAILEEELTAGLALINSLDEEQRSVAIVKQNKITNNNRGELFQDNAIVEYAGISLAQLTLAQRERALELITLYIGNISEGHAEIKLSEIVRHWNDTHFAWVGGTERASIFYYRIHSPVVMIEYDHQKPVALDGPDLPSQDHVHTVVRTPNGNDYGKDLLRQHLSQHGH
ncbi:MAG: DUF3500 domain-containing protein [Gammaproteobacteria bacterium]|nr:MAG: DUF3500 domain-containing protein [Gammaproteobacteria bacterium]